MQQLKNFAVDALTWTGDQRIGGFRDKDFAIIAALWLLLGIFGAHRFYARQWGTAILMLLTLGGLGVWWMVDLFLLDRLVYKLRARRLRPLLRRMPPF